MSNIYEVISHIYCIYSLGQIGDHSELNDV